MNFRADGYILLYLGPFAKFAFFPVNDCFFCEGYCAKIVSNGIFTGETVRIGLLCVRFKLGQVVSRISIPRPNEYHFPIEGCPVSQRSMLGFRFILTWTIQFLTHSCGFGDAAQLAQADSHKPTLGFVGLGVGGVDFLLCSFEFLLLNLQQPLNHELAEFNFQQFYCKSVQQLIGRGGALPRVSEV